MDNIINKGTNPAEDTVSESEDSWELMSWNGVQPSISVYLRGTASDGGTHDCLLGYIVSISNPSIVPLLKTCKQRSHASTISYCAHTPQSSSASLDFMPLSCNMGALIGCTSGYFSQRVSYPVFITVDLQSLYGLWVSIPKVLSISSVVSVIGASGIAMLIGLSGSTCMEWLLPVMGV